MDADVTPGLGEGPAPRVGMRLPVPPRRRGHADGNVGREAPCSEKAGDADGDVTRPVEVGRAQDAEVE